MKISLIEFSFKNYKIFQNKVTFSLNHRKNEAKTFLCAGENLLRTSLIYGPNASGKTSVLEALQILRAGVTASANSSEGDLLPYYPYLLSVKKNEPSFFEIVFSIDEKIYRYSFSILADHIVAEDLLQEVSEDRRLHLISRKEQSILVDHEFKTSEDVISKTRKEVLFLSAAAQWNNGLAISIVQAFQNINVIFGQKSNTFRAATMRYIQEDSAMKAQILNYLKRADLGIIDAFVAEREVPDQVKTSEQAGSRILTSYIRKNTVKFTHNKFGAKNEIVGTEIFDLEDESEGTKRFFDVLGPIVDTLNRGRVLAIDEFDNSLHPELTLFIVNLFEKENPNNAQLIATTHDTSLLGKRTELIKAQVWFTDKDKYNAADLFSLDEFDLRNDTEFQNKYLEGRFGAVPFIDHP